MVPLIATKMIDKAYWEDHPIEEAPYEDLQQMSTQLKILFREHLLLGHDKAVESLKPILTKVNQELEKHDGRERLCKW